MLCGQACSVTEGLLLLDKVLCECTISQKGMMCRQMELKCGEKNFACI